VHASAAGSERLGKQRGRKSTKNKLSKYIIKNQACAKASKPHILVKIVLHYMQALQQGSIPVMCQNYCFETGQ